MKSSPFLKSAVIAIALFVSMLALPGESFADGEAREIRGLFVVSLEGKKSNGSVWGKTIKNVTVIRLGRNFVTLKTGDSGHAFHQKTIDSIRWESLERKADIAKSTVVKGKKNKSEAELSKELDKLFDEIDTLIDRSDYDGLLSRFEKLQALLKEYADLGPKVSKEKLAKWMKKLKGSELSDVRRALQLQVFISNGNKILREMSANLRKQYNGNVIRGFAKMEKLCAEMKSHKDEMFTQNAKALYERAKELKEKAIKNLKDK